MKILTIRGRNLASLEGEFVLDFTREPLLSAGIYAITGPTGSGKSTILDALCLALFGRSPRQVAARESGVELPDGENGSVAPGDPRTILRKGSAEGYAAAAFIGLDGQPWESEWTVRRARNRPSGNLQDYTLRLTNLTTRLPFAGTKTETLREIERVIGLNYEQFTRSVLLAQGDFTAFLKAARDDKASLLEKITGTEIYSRISVSVFMKSREAEAALKEIRDRLSGIVLPGEGETEALKAGEATHAEAVSALERQREEIRRGLEWHRQREQLIMASGEARARLATAEAALQEAAGRETHFRLVEKIQPTRPLVESLREKRETLALKREAEKDTANRVSEARKAMEELSATIREAEDAVKETTAATAAARPLLLRAREMDTLLVEQHKKVSEAETGKQTAFDEHQLLLGHLAAREKNLEELRREKGETQDWLREKEPRRGIAENATLIVSRLEYAQQCGKEATELTGWIEEAVKKNLLLESRKGQLREEVAAKEKESQELTALSDQIGEQMAAIPVETLTEAETQHTAEMVRTSAMRACWEKHTDLAARKSVLGEEITGHRAALENEEGELEARRSESEEVKVRREQTGRMLSQARLAAAENVEKLRGQLLPGEACPVCGSTHHPWAEGDPRVHAMLEELEKEEARLASSWQENVEAQARLFQSGHHHREAIARGTAEMEKLMATLEKTTREWEGFHPGEKWLAEPEETWAALLEMETEEHRRAAEEARATLARYRELAVKAGQIRQSMDQNRLSRDHSGEALTACLSGIMLLTAEKQQREALREQNLTKQREALASAGVYFTQSGWEEKWAVSPETFTAKLITFSASWQSKNKRLNEIAGEERVLETEIKNLKERITETAGKLAQAEEREKGARERVAAAEQERQKLFGGREASVVEEELARAGETCQHRLRELRETLGTMQAGIAEMEGSLRLRREDLAKQEEDLETLRLRLSGWLQQFAAAGNIPLGEEELNHLLEYTPEWITMEREALGELRDTVLSGRSTLEEREKQLETHLQSGRETPEKPALEALLTETEAALDLQNGELTEIRFRLRTYEENLKKAGAFRELEEERSGTAGKWKKLNELLGSADGRKFRQIAQEYTLEVLLTYANLHLRELTGRYRLEVISGTLSLQVIDRDMGDEIRSVHSLSGGESFLVSLALALGLASLSSNRMTIESLFIDEGFGSLDPQTLGMAMDALERLRNQGRKVGVISHVREMTERIGTQVRVTRQANGRSSVEVTLV